MHHRLFGLVDFNSSSLHQAIPAVNMSYHDKQISLFNHCTKHRSFAIQFQGKLYNHDSLKQALSIKESLSDALLLLEAYHVWGIELLEKLDGIYAFALYDAKQAIMILAKDRVSIKPLYFYHDKNKLLFSSSLKALTRTSLFQKEMAPQALSNYFTYGYILQPNTIYKNCYKIKSGHFLTIDLKTKSLREQKYWSLADHYKYPKIELSKENCLKEAKHLLQNSIKKRLVVSNNYGASLSGGYDSSVIAAILQEQSPKPLKTFTIGFEESSINEAPDAKRIAKHLGTEHTEYYFTQEDAKNIIPKLSEVYDEPFYDNGSIPTTLLSQIASQQGIDTIFAGDGGDEVFATADDSERFERILSAPYSLRLATYKFLNLINPNRVPYLQHYNNIPTKYYKFLHILKAHNIPEMVKIKMTLFHPDEIQQLLHLEDTSFDSIFDTINFGEHAQSVDQIIGTYFKTFLTDGELIKTTNAFRAQGISIREPYLDPQLIAYMAKIPASLKTKGGIKKYILKEIAYDYIPKPLLDKPKQGFSIPFSQWMKGALNPLMMDTLSEENLKNNSILDVSFVTTLKNKFLQGNEANKYKLWSILLYQLWYEKNINQ